MIHQNVEKTCKYFLAKSKKNGKFFEEEENGGGDFTATKELTKNDALLILKDHFEHSKPLHGSPLMLNENFWDYISIHNFLAHTIEDIEFIPFYYTTKVSILMESQA